MVELWVAILGIAAGAGGFLLATFYFQPILRYRDIRNQITSDLVFYANAISGKGMNEEFKQRVLERLLANRRHSADLLACFSDLPKVYQVHLKQKGHQPESASRYLMQLSNTDEYEPAGKCVDAIVNLLQIDRRVLG